MNGKAPPRIRFAHLPTPIDPMHRLTSAIRGPKLWIKRDDQTGLAFGGNKTRKLEFLVAEAQAQGAKTLLTAGAPQSNHCRQTAAAAARFGFQCKLLLVGHPPQEINGNLLLDELLGAELIWAETEDADQELQGLFEEVWAAGERPYLIPVGGSNPVGAAGYAAAMAEFVAQDLEVDRIVFATSSGGTQAGLLAGAKIHGYRGKITGILIGKYKHTAEVGGLMQLVQETADLLGESIDVSEKDVDIRDGYLGEGYGIVSELEREAIHLFAKTEGILLDPVYTGRAAGGMLDLIQKGEIDQEERVLFWHTGGTPALFAYVKDLR